MWREQKQLWEACLHWPVVTVTVMRAGQSSPGVEGKATERQPVTRRVGYYSHFNDSDSDHDLDYFGS